MKKETKIISILLLSFSALILQPYILTLNYADVIEEQPYQSYNTVIFTRCFEKRIALNYLTGATTSWGCSDAPVQYWNTLFYFNERSSSASTPVLGVYLDPVDSEYKVWELKVRNDAYWSDGVKFTIDDVLYTLDLYAQYPESRGSGWVNQYLDHYGKIDNYTAKIYLKVQDTRMKSQWTGYTGGWEGLGGGVVLPKHIYEEIEDPVNWLPINSVELPNMSPYVIESIDEDSGYIYCKRLEDWWGTEIYGKPKPEYLIFRTISTIDWEVQELIAHKLQYTCEPGFVMYDDIRSRNSYVHGVFYSDPPSTIFPNSNNYPLNMSEVRWALNWGLDKERINTVIYKGTSKIIKGPWRDTIYNQRWEMPKYDITEYNPQKAIENFESLGFTRGTDGIFVTPNGTRLSFRFVYGTDQGAWRVAIAEAAAEDWREIGVEIQLAPMLMGQFWGEIDAKNYDLAGIQFVGWDPNDLLDFFQMYLSDRGGFERGGWSNSTFDTLVQQLYTVAPPSVDPSSDKLYFDILEIWLAECPSIFTVYNKAMSYFDTYWWTGFPSTSNPDGTGDESNWYCSSCGWATSFKDILLHLDYSEANVAARAAIAEAKEMAAVNEARQQGYTQGLTYGGIAVVGVGIVAIIALFWQRRAKLVR